MQQYATFRYSHESNSIVQKIVELSKGLSPGG